MGNCISKDQAKDAEEVLTTAAGLIANHVPSSTPEEKSTPPEPKTLLSNRPNTNLKEEAFDLEKTGAMLDMGIEVIDLFQKVAKVAEMAVPTPLGDLLEKVTSVLGTLKKMVENRQAWRGLLSKIDEHQKTFNDQLVRLKAADMAPDPESPLLGPVMQYSQALEKIAAKIMEDGGLLSKDAPESSGWQKLKEFAVRAMNVDSEKANMDGYLKELSVAMEQFKFTLEIFVGFTVEAIKGGVESLITDLKAVGQDVKEVQDTLARNAEPQDTISTINVGPLGQQHKTCLPGTRVDVLADIRAWALAKDNTTPVYCIGDVAGTGKSTVTRTMYDEWVLNDQNPLAFFFSQQGVESRNANNLCAYIASQLQALVLPELKEYWERIAPTLPFLKEQDIAIQWKKLVYDPLCKLPKSVPRILVIDALDECTLDTRGKLLLCILEACASGALAHIRIFITTRNEPDILNVLQNTNHSKLIIHRALRSSTNANSDVALYINHRLDETGVFASAPEQRQLLIERCNGLFIFAFLACKLLEDACGDEQPLKDILHEFTSLDVLYHQTLVRADKVPKYTRQLLKDILGVIVVAQEPLSIAAVASLLPLNPDKQSSPPNSDKQQKDVANMVANLGSILGSGGVDEPVYILHATFTEFLLRQRWVTTKNETVTNEYVISRVQSNRAIARSCLRVLLNELKESSGENVSAALRYAALVWVVHLIPNLHVRDLRASLKQFFEKKLLNWIELGAMCKTLPKYILAMGRLHSAMEKMRGLTAQSIQPITEEEYKWCTDTVALFRLHQRPLQQLPQSVYSSLIVFTPPENKVSSHYQPLLRAGLPDVVIGHATEAPQSVVFPGHNGVIRQVAYSSNGELLASAALGPYGYGPAEIMVWDVATGARLVEHKVEASSQLTCYGIGFLPGDKTVVSAWNGAAELYDTQLYRLSCETGELVCPPQTLPWSGEINCVSWSPDWTKVTCGTLDGKIGQFSLENATQVGQILKAHEGKINTLSFSPDGLTLVSTSYDNTLKVWAVGPQALTGPGLVWTSETLEIYGAAICPTDPSLLAVAVGDCLHLRSVTSGDLILDCGQKDAFSATVYSPDGKYIATLGYDQRWIKLSTRNDKEMIGMSLSTGHNLLITSLAFSPDKEHVVSGSEDQTIRIHNLANTGPITTAQCHQTRTRRMAFTSDCKRMVSSDENGVIFIWDMKTGKLVDGPIQTDMGSSNSIAISSDGLTIASADRSDTVALWDIKSRAKVTVELPLGYSTASDQPLEVHTMVLSPNDSTLAFMARGYFEDCEREMVVLKDLRELSSIAVTVEPNLQPMDASSFSLAYHPTGDYICCAEQAWDLTVKPPAPVSGGKLDIILKETFPVFHDFAYDAEGSLPTISFGSAVRHNFSVPQDLHAYVFGVYDSFVAIGSEDGRVTVLDFTRILTPEETALLNKSCDMRHRACTRSGPSPLQGHFSS